MEAKLQLLSQSDVLNLILRALGGISQVRLEADSVIIFQWRTEVWRVEDSLVVSHQSANTFVNDLPSELMEKLLRCADEVLKLENKLANL